MRALFFSLVVYLWSVGIVAQCPASLNISAPETIAWTGKLLSALAQENSCAKASTDDQFASSSACNIFVGRVLETVYGVKDFESNKSGQAYLQANDIGTLLQTGVLDHWKLVGTGDDQASLLQAKQYADQGKLVLAVYEVPGHLSNGHVALIGPGPMTPSGSWKLSTPASASFFLGKPAKAFLGQPLTCAFPKEIKSSVKIWVKSP
jgi:hypothetical protein